MNRFAISLLAGVAAISLASAATAADLIIEEPTPVGIVDVGGDWDGVYIGAFAGYGWGTLTDDDDLIGLTDVDNTLAVDGWLLGLNVGANFTVSEAIVAGIVADIAWSDISGDDGDFSYSVDWVGSVRGRLGFDGGAFLPYLTAGLAFASATATEAAFEDSATHIGWTVGAGVEFAVADNVSVDLLYRYSDYGAQDYSLVADPTSISLTSHQVTAGLNWRF